ncbi:divalent metal cation transporter [Acidobacteria bacterium AH-259-L09]|nr:divalent metal cation transporter [Acidobacteria bacterium AH-259-L09]
MTSQQEFAQQTELEYLRKVNARPWAGRLLGYARLSGPGWIQGAITLGAGTATSAFYLGWKFGYQMLWVNILGMAMGVIMFAAIARPSLYRDESLYRAMGKYVHPALALAWAIAAIVTSIFWCLNQYAAAAACFADLVQLGGWVSTEQGLLSARWMVGAMILAVSIPLTWTYGGKPRTGIRLYETILKSTVFFMILCFALVAWKTGIRWGELFRGLIPGDFPGSSDDRTMVLGALGCTVGINMTFLFPITLRARGWTQEHLGLARFDLGSGMLLPFAIISSLVVITTANVLQGSPERPDGPAAVAKVMTPLFEGTWLPDATGRVLFDLGIAAMPLSTITILMLISGLALCEIRGVPYRGWWFRLGSLLPTVGIFGVAYKAPFWLGPLISSFALILLPIAYLGFLVLCNRRAFLGPDLPTGSTRWAWNTAMGCVLAIALVGASVKVADSLATFFKGL